MVLHLTLQKKWFDLIRSGKKTEEYRDIKPYWATRLSDLPYDWCKDIELFKQQFEPHWTGFEQNFKPYTHIKFTNGYSVTSPTFTIECTGIRIGRGNPEWGAPIDKDVFILSLGKIVES